MREFGKFVEGKLKTCIADECPEGMKEVFREPIIPEDKEVIFDEKENAIYITYDKSEEQIPPTDE